MQIWISAKATSLITDNQITKFTEEVIMYVCKKQTNKNKHFKHFSSSTSNEDESRTSSHHKPSLLSLLS